MSAAIEGAPTEALAGLVERITDHDVETGALVLQVMVRGALRRPAVQRAVNRTGCSLLTWDAGPHGGERVVDLHEKDWRWYQTWLDEVLRHCRKSASSLVDVAREGGLTGMDPTP